MTTLAFKGYEGTAEIDMERGVCRGKILFIDDLVIYEADAPKALQGAFEEAVADYVGTCRLVGKAPQKPLRGQFNVRVEPEQHRLAALRAIKDGVTLNDVMKSALKVYLSADTNINHRVTVTIDNPSGHFAMSASAAGAPLRRQAHAH